MLTPRIRLFLAAITLAFGAYRLVGGHVDGTATLAVSAYMIFSYIKQGTVQLAFRAVARGQVEQAAQLLKQVKRPDSLVADERAYFELASGFVCAARGQNDPAEQHLRRALTGPLRSENDRALAETVLAQLLIAREERGEARAVLDQAAQRRCHPEVSQRIVALRDELPTGG